MTRMRSKQYIVRAHGCAMGITFDADEESRVRAAASRSSLSVEDLIEKTINTKLARRSWNTLDELHSWIVATINELGSARSRKMRAR